MPNMRMNNLISQYSRIAPITETKPKIDTSKVTQKNFNKSFADILEKQIPKNEGLNFSKHARLRMQQRDMKLSEEQMGKLSTAVKKAQEKGVRDTLILMDRMAFIVNISKSTVITAMKDQDIEGNIFTDIDGAVVI